MRFRFCLLLLSCFCSCSRYPGDNSPPAALNGEYWKKQALTDILPYWTNNARDTAYGAFHTSLGANWEPSGDPLIYPSMISRHLFSYSVAFLMTGDKHYLTIADSTSNYLLRHAWDKEYGGWYNALERNGSVADSGKATFIQVYANTGLAMYYFVTLDATVRKYIDASNRLLESNTWDHEYDGYYNAMTRDWQVNDDRKSFSSQVAHISGYLITLYLATGDEKYLLQAERIMKVIMDRMWDEKTGWLCELFNRTWEVIPGAQDEINIGHNLEVAWMLRRLAMLRQQTVMDSTFQRLVQNLRNYGFCQAEGIWFVSVDRLQPVRNSNDTYWWIQAYGNMFCLSMYRATGDKKYLEDFERSARFWNRYIIDTIHGDTYFRISRQGEVLDSIKANPYKTSYHSMEHGFLNYLYLKLWLQDQAVELYFHSRHPEQKKMLRPVPVEDMNICIRKIVRDDESFVPPDNECVREVLLPPLKQPEIKVLLGRRKKAG